ncbi:hypothetical protein MNV49_004743 [Pseudohyphozyma bogoriensis]|nr:hypothetical protein MNV49_004743 [Pseudohyphozyma bogoriensis]
MASMPTLGSIISAAAQTAAEHWSSRTPSRAPTPPPLEQDYADSSTLCSDASEDVDARDDDDDHEHPFGRSDGYDHSRQLAQRRSQSTLRASAQQHSQATGVNLSAECEQCGNSVAVQVPEFIVTSMNDAVKYQELAQEERREGAEREERLARRTGVVDAAVQLGDAIRLSGVLDVVALFMLRVWQAVCVLNAQFSLWIRFVDFVEWLANKVYEVNRDYDLFSKMGSFLGEWAGTLTEAFLRFLATLLYPASAHERIPQTAAHQHQQYRAQTHPSRRRRPAPGHVHVHPPASAATASYPRPLQLSPTLPSAFLPDASLSPSSSTSDIGRQDGSYPFPSADGGVSSSMETHHLSHPPRRRRTQSENDHFKRQRRPSIPYNHHHDESEPVRVADGRSVAVSLLHHAAEYLAKHTAPASAPVPAMQ